MKKILSIFSLIVILVIGFGCSKKKGCTDKISVNYNPDAEENDGSCEYAGLGGQTTIVASPQHHGVPIVSSMSHPDSAFVKFNATESPGSTAAAYDKIFTGEDGEAHVHLAGLKRGQYYILMAGWDTTSNERVSGGRHYVLTQSSGEVNLIVPVVE